MDTPFFKEQAEFFDLAIDMLCIASFEGYFLRVNPMFEKVLGWSKTELLSKRFLEFVHPDDIQDTMNATIALSKGQDILNFLNRYLCKDGNYKWIEWRSYSFVEKGYIYAIARDVTERVNEENKLKELQNILRSFVDELPIGAYFYRLNPNGDLIFEGANKEALKLVPLDLKKEIGRTMEEVFPPLMATELPQNYKRIAREGGIYKINRVEYRRDDFFGIYDVKVFRYSENRIAVVFFDVTLETREEENRRKMEQSVQHIQRLESMGILAGGIAHDFNNILLAAITNLDLLLDELNTTPEIEFSLNNIKEALMKANKLTKQMLLYSGRGSSIKNKIDLNEIIEEFLPLIRTSFSRHKRIESQLEPMLPPIFGNKEQIEQVLLNLIINSSESIDETGRKDGIIKVKTGSYSFNKEQDHIGNFGFQILYKDYVFLEVSDNGNGLTKENKNHLFELFYSTKFSGRGLGLASIYGIVKEHKGFIEVSSEEGKGATFSVFFPIIQE
jgi:two-component system cell cycle sensor histidine kinase/response regulator CckA